MEILQELNEKQQQAAAHTDGAMLVVAGPGTGKTNVITHRIAHLIRNHQIAPQQIFAVTFTNKAAQEMLDRIKELLGTTQGLEVRIHTFHAFCVRLLRDTRRDDWVGCKLCYFQSGDTGRGINRMSARTWSEPAHLSPVDAARHHRRVQDKVGRSNR